MRPLDPDLVLILPFVATMAIIVPIVWAVVRRIAGRTAPTATPLPSDVAARLERLEQIAEATQLEVERMSEGQRFTTRLLTERAHLHVPDRVPEVAPDRLGDRMGDRMGDRFPDRTQPPHA